MRAATVTEVAANLPPMHRRWAPGDWRNIVENVGSTRCAACGGDRMRVFMPAHTGIPYVFECMAKRCGAVESIP